MKSKNLVLAALMCLILSHNSLAFADDETDAYDPFIDYNEYEVASEEEADINFFRNGRFLTMGFTLGQRTFTEGMADIYSNDIVYGLYLSYFFDMRFALQFGWHTGSHDIQVGTATGKADISTTSVHIKYYLNTQNVTRGLASLNPYVIGGFGSTSRESTVDGQPEIGKESAMGFDLGGGIEFPMLNNKMYFGGQLLYSVVNFDDENTEIKLDGGTVSTGKYGNGDFITLMGIIGVNF
jgi:hypothetical protein